MVLFVDCAIWQPLMRHELKQTGKTSVNTVNLFVLFFFKKEETIYINHSMQRCSSRE